MLKIFPAILRKVLLDLHSSYWFIPAALTLFALAASIGSEWLDRQGMTGWLPAILFETDASAARSILGVIAQSSLGAAGVMFSMTMVAVSFASSNFGPRLVGNFMQDRGVQISLGVLLSTFVFALTILRAVEDSGGDDGWHPTLSLTIALFLALASVGVLIYFVHHIPEIISLENLSARLGRSLMETIARLPDADHHKAPELVGTTYDVTLDEAGYLQALDADKLRKLAKRHDLLLRLRATPGAFVAPHAIVLTIASPNPPSKRELDQLKACFAVGTGRTEAQNPLFIAQQLVEILARALSPGVNDPVTAMNCLSWLHAALHQLANRGPVDAVGTDALCDPELYFSFLSLLDCAHTDTRPYVATDPLVTQHAHRLLEELLAELPQGPRRESVETQRQALISEAQALRPENREVSALADNG